MRCHRLFILPLLALGCGTAATPMPFELTDTEVRLARDLAEAREPLQAIHYVGSVPVVVFIKAELLPASQAETTERQVMLQHYRYRDDATVFTRVDLNNRTVLGSETALHYPTGLASSEVQRAEELARADARLHTMIEVQRLRLIPRPLQAAPGNPLHGHRVVHFQFQRGDESLTEPRVLVDLTEGKVLVGNEG